MPIDKCPFNDERRRHMTTNEPLAYSIRDAIAVSSIKRTRIYELIRDKKLEVTHVGRRTLVNAASLRRLIENGD
jgi:hypothetical protein